jgi:hypothetical protein
MLYRLHLADELMFFCFIKWHLTPPMLSNIVDPKPG